MDDYGFPPFSESYGIPLFHIRERWRTFRPFRE